MAPPDAVHLQPFKSKEGLPTSKRMITALLTPSSAKDFQKCLEASVSEGGNLLKEQGLGP